MTLHHVGVLKCVINTCICSASQILTDDQAAWVKQTSERVLKILRETPPDGELFTDTVTVCQCAVMQSSAHMLWCSHSREICWALLPWDAVLGWHTVALCLYVHPSVTSYCYTNVAEHMITERTLYNSQATSFLTPNIAVKFEWFHSNMGVRYTWGRLKSAIFNQYFTVTENRARYGHCYYRRLIGTCMCSTE